jgi:hypothetical protein
MVQRFVAFVILAIGAVSSSHAFDLDVFSKLKSKAINTCYYFSY